MKNIAYKILILICIFIYYNLNNQVYSYNNAIIYLSSNNQIIKKGDEIEIKLYIQNSNIAAFTSYIKFDNLKLEYISGPENTNVIEDRIITIWYDQTGGNEPKEGEVATFKFKSIEKGNATFSIDGEFYDNNQQLIQSEFKDLQIQIVDEKDTKTLDNQATGPKLQTLRLNKEGIVPNFNKDIFEYYLTVDNQIEDIEIVAISDNQNATVEIEGNTNLKQGLNIINIKVSNQNVNNVYKINVTKTNDIESANSNLEILAIEDILLNPPFYTSITNYNVEVSKDTSKINIFAIPENENATVQIIGAEGISEGNNYAKVIVTAQNGFSQKVYGINIYKRNSQEENKYKEEQKANKENLKKIYESETLNSEVEEDLENNIEEHEENIEKKDIKFYVLIIFLIAIIIIVILFWKHSRHNLSGT